MGGLFRCLLLIGFVAAYWPVILAAVVVVEVGVVAWWAYTLHLAAVEQTARERAAIAARADEQHAQVLAGDERGVYGDYPPAV